MLGIRIIRSNLCINMYAHYKAGRDINVRGKMKKIEIISAYP